ncbi:MAG: glycosyltransferase family 2 protein [Promethearchaeota archaeon]
MKLSIIIPCYNEDKTIKPLLNEFFKINFPIDYEIIVVDDGSKVNHKKYVAEEIKTKKVTFIRLPQNQGKGVAIRVGLKYATGDIFIIQDADFEYYPSDIPKLLEPILKREVNVVYGSRFYSKPKEMSKSHLIGNLFLTKLTNLLFNVNLTDMETGYKVFTRTVLENIELSAREFEFEPEITSQILLKGFKIKEYPIEYNIRRYGFAKINYFDGIEGALVLLKFRLFSSSKLFQFIYNVYKIHFKKIMKKIQKKIPI